MSTASSPSLRPNGWRVEDGTTVQELSGAWSWSRVGSVTSRVGSHRAHWTSKETFCPVETFQVVLMFCSLLSDPTNRIDSLL